MFVLGENRTCDTFNLSGFGMVTSITRLKSYKGLVAHRSLQSERRDSTLTAIVWL